MTHYSSIHIINVDELPDNIVLYGDTHGESYENPEVFGSISKYIVATMTSDDFTTWDYTESEEVESFTVWNSDGTALWITAVTISYCYANIALEAKPIIVDGVEYQAVAVYAASIFNAYSSADNSYIGSTVNKIIQAELTEDNNYIVTVPRVTAYEYSTSKPEGYDITPMECIIIAYGNADEDVTFKIQPIGIAEYYPE